jgi:methionyl-tRNA synthetase
MSATTKAKQKLIITSALPYVNNTPHLGNVVGCVLSADVYARYAKKILNRDTLFIGGVDEYGTATEMKARELGISCKELCDLNYDIHKAAYDWFKIDFDCYGRTSQPNGNPHDADLTWPHTTITRDIYQRLVKSGLIIELEETVWYCEEIDAFVADRYIISECYHCESEKADGDQCDACGNLLSTDKLVNPRYKPNPDFVLQKQTTKNLYIDLPTIWETKNMDEWFANNMLGWSDTAVSITENWVDKKGLKPRSITRDLKWGTRVPDTAKYGDAYANKVFYVWFDAPIGYLSILERAIGTESAHVWWNEDAELVQFMAKDNVPFHSIIFPCTLAPLSRPRSPDPFEDAGHNEIVDYSLPRKVRIASTDYLMYEGQKFSKSKNTGLFCDDVAKIGATLNLDADLFRAYLIYVRPESSDSNFVMNENGFVDFVNSILIHNLGNMTHRIRSILFQYGKKHENALTQYDSRVTPGDLGSVESSDSMSDVESSSDDNSEFNLIDPVSDFHIQVNELFNRFEDQMNDIKLRAAFKTLMEISSNCNVLINVVKPWTHIKMDRLEIPPLFYEFMVTIYHTIRRIGQNIEPFMPGIGQQIKADYILDETDDGIIQIVVPTSKPKPMFKPLEYIDLSAILE